MFQSAPVTGRKGLGEVTPLPNPITPLKGEISNRVLFSMNIRAALISISCSLLACNALAQWQWLDESGRKTFSDRPPPAHIPEKNILKAPAVAGTLPISSALPQAEVPEEVKAAEAAEAEAAKQAAAQQQTQAEEALRQKQAALAQAAEAKQQEEELAQRMRQRQENCGRAQAALRTLNSNAALAQPGADGQPTVMSSAQRQQEIRRMQDVVTRDCGPLKAE